MSTMQNLTRTELQALAPNPPDGHVRAFTDKDRKDHSVKMSRFVMEICDENLIRAGGGTEEIKAAWIRADAPILPDTPKYPLIRPNTF